MVKTKVQAFCLPIEVLDRLERTVKRDPHFGARSHIVTAALNAYLAQDETPAQLETAGGSTTSEAPDEYDE